MNRENWKRSVCRLLWLCFMLAIAVPFSMGAPVIVPPVIQRNYDAAKHRYQTNSSDDEAGWQLGRACFDRAEFSRDNSERATLAHEGIAACEQVIARQPNLAAGHYYLAMNLAQLARTKLLGALPILGRMESGWLAALRLDGKMDYAGPDRYVGLLYRDAPGWPVSLGDTKKAKQHLAQAVELCPAFPENYLNLMESEFMWNEPKAVAPDLEKLRQLLPAARKEFAGEYWEVSWQDWNERIGKIEARLKARGDH